MALAEIPPLAQAAARSLGAALLVAGCGRARAASRCSTRDGTLRGGLLAGALFAAEFACIFVGLQFTTASRMVVFIYLSPFVVALGMPFIARGERPGARAVAGLADRRSPAWPGPLPRALRQPAAGARPVARRRARRARRRAVGRDHAGDPRHRGWRARRPRRPCCTSWRCRARCWPGRRGRPASRWPAQLSALALGLAGLPDGDRHLRQLPALVLAGAPLPGHAAGRVHAADAGVRPDAPAWACWASR